MIDRITKSQKMFLDSLMSEKPRLASEIGLYSTPIDGLSKRQASVMIERMLAG